MTMATSAKITVYMPVDEIADLDQLRAELLRDGLNIDRGRMVRAALSVARRDTAAWFRAMREEE